MKVLSFIGMSLALLCFALMSGCAGCDDEFGVGCTSDEDCRVGRMCIEEACAPAQDTGTPLDDEEAGPGDSDDEPPSTPPSEPPSEPGTPSETMVEEYCAMESSCIPVCVMGPSESLCNSPERRDACPQDFERWYDRLTSQDTRCAQTVDAWIECISAASCEEVEEFFQAHPDGVTDATPCAGEFFKMECIDFEPVTEYGF
jgi:(2Fe-2S) ferredoxin